ncbi:MAG: hypothetical protein JWP82_901 [Humibacillus sp.]|nr:hypothetical protein [Humibacillus sp.]
MTTFTDAFRSVVAERGDHTAIIEGARELTFGQLAERASAYRDTCLARGLRPGQVVVLQLERGIEATAAMIGIALAGGAYTVIGENYPLQRRAAMLETLDLAFVLDAPLPYAASPAQPAATVTAEPGTAAERDVARTPDALLYVVFTSGTTSTPKAVGVPDRAVLRLLGETRLGLVPGDRITHDSTIEFDASVIELWGGLLSGMSVLCVPTREVIDPFVMLEVISHRADVMWLTSSLFNFFVDKRPEAFAGLKRVVVGGEALSLHHVNRALPHVEVVNGYGPTENTVFTTLDVMSGPSTPDISIGTAVAGTELLVVGPDGLEAEEGELLALGDGLALGYLGDPVKTAAAFVDRHGRRAYRTGDYVRRRPDGRIDYRGRMDTQVKISGYRIDLQEIEAVFLECGAGTAKAFVDDGKVLVAVTARGEDLRGDVAAYLPAYMQPRSILHVDTIPMTPNGKADVPALLALAARPAAAVTAPSRPAPADVRAIVEAQHGAALPDGVDDLFALGFDSIGLWSLVTAVNDAHGTDLTLFDALDDPRISALERLAAPAAAA